MSASDIAVVFGLSPTGLSVARSLAPRGVTVYGVDALWYEFGHFSRAVKHDRRISHQPPGPSLLEGLLALGRELPQRAVIFNASDEYIDFVAEHRDALQQYYILTNSMRAEANSLLLNKRTFYDKCRTLGIGMPATFYPATDQEALAAADQLRYPAIIKPVHGHKWRKALKGHKLIEVQNRDELLRWYHTFQTWGAEVLLQECIVGSEQNIAVAGMYTDAAGVCRSMFTARKYRQYPPMYGSGSYMEAKWIPEIAELSVDLITKLKYHGVCGTEFKYDTRDQQWKLIEVNCRPTLWFALTRAAGVDVVWDAYCDLAGKPSPVHIGQQDDRVRWQLFVRDAVSAIYFARRGELSPGEFVRTVIDPRRKQPAAFSWTDWGVNVGYAVNTLMQIWRNFVTGR